MGFPKVTVSTIANTPPSLSWGTEQGSCPMSSSNSLVASILVFMSPGTTLHAEQELCGSLCQPWIPGSSRGSMQGRAQTPLLLKLLFN